MNVDVVSEMDSCICPKCGKMFNNRSNLNRHIAVHSKQGRFFCCGKPFQDSYHLRLHRASKHGGPKDYVCSFCRKSFSSFSALTKHQKTESKESFVKCEVCQLEVRDKNALKEHMASHGSEGTYACDMCDKVYKQKCSLSRHRKIMHQKDISETWCYGQS